MKKIISMALAVIMLLTMLSTTAFAAAPSTSADTNVFDILNRATSGVSIQSANGSIVYTITNPEIIRQLSDEAELPDMIELTYTPSVNTQIIANGGEATPMLFADYEIRNKVDHGDGWYNSSAHQVYEFYIDGPDTFVLDETHSYSASVNCSIEAAIEVISAGVGFEIGEEHQLHFQSNTPVDAGKRLHVEVFRTHRKVTFDLYKNPLIGGWTFVDDYEALKPNGTFIKKEFWNL